jgi:YebC/PmpR family DNA-binding regulatory protein
MSGHSKWNSIKHKKGAADAKRGKIFTMHAKLITIAARGGGDADMNPNLRSAIDRAKADNVPNNNIDRAIKKGTGEDKDAASYEEITYEAMGPGGTAFMIDVITDNKNRSLTNVRTIVNKNGGSFGSAGSVAWKFDKRALLIADPAGMDLDEAELTLIDCGADDLARTTDGKFEIYAGPSQCSAVKKAAEEAGLKIEKDELIWKAKEEMNVADAGLAKKVLKLMDALDEDEDVSQVSSNVDLDDSVLAEI